MIKRLFKCLHCEKTFVRKSWFDKHMCDKKRQFNKANNLDQIKALRLFNHWMRRHGFLKRKHADKTMEEFQRSPYAKNFLELVLFSHDTDVITVFKYLNYLIDHQIGQTKWCKGTTVDAYRDYVACNDKPLVQARDTCIQIREWCLDKQIPVNHFFEEVGAGDALNMILTLKISPWVLFSYNAAIDLINRLDREKMHILDEHIGFEFWKIKLESNPEAVREVNEYCTDQFST